MTPEGILTVANKTALALRQSRKPACSSKPFWETPWWTHSPEFAGETSASGEKAGPRGIRPHVEVTHRRGKTDDLPWIDFSLKPVKDETGKVVFLIAEGRDITDRKRAEEAIHQEQRLLHDMLDLHERDRKLVAYEIHDGLAQQLTGRCTSSNRSTGCATAISKPPRRRATRAWGCCARRWPRPAG